MISRKGVEYLNVQLQEITRCDDRYSESTQRQTIEQRTGIWHMRFNKGESSSRNFGIHLHCNLDRYLQSNCGANIDICRESNAGSNRSEQKNNLKQ